MNWSLKYKRLDRDVGGNPEKYARYGPKLCYEFRRSLQAKFFSLVP